MKRSGVTENAYVEKKMTAGVRHAKIACVIALVVLVALVIDCEMRGQSRAASEGIGYIFVVMLARWLFDGLESIIGLLCSLKTAPSTGTKFPDAAFSQQPAPTSAPRQPTPQQPMTQDDPAHWPKQEPMETGIDVAAALRAAEDLDRN